MTVALRSFSRPQRIALVVPPVLIVSMYAAFRYFTATLGFPSGYLAGFAVYWLMWCGLLPAALMGRRQLADLQRPHSIRRVDRTTRLLLLWPIAFPLAFAVIPRIGSVTVPILIASIALGVVIGVSEELLWRGVYVALFGDRWWLSTVYPSMAFGLWHLCPLAVLPSRYPGGALSFAAYSVALGFSYAHYARRAQSIFWCTISHCVHDALGLGGVAYAMWLQ